MINLPGYKVNREIFSGDKTVIFGGVRETDQQAVVLKMSTIEYPTLKDMSRFKREYEIASELDLNGVVKTYGLEQYQNTYVLVSEDFQGISLNRVLEGQKLDMRMFLKIAVSLAETLGEIHRRGIIHKDIKPSNVIINTETGQVKITDFGISTFLSREVQNIMSPNHLEGTLAYMSPEQTGRMNRAIDYRSDFYSLGVLFYEILTGVLPFRSRDPMELVHSHIAKIPEPPHLMNTNISRTVSDIVMKLLEKNAENRYQSDFGLKADLEEAQQQLLDKGKISDFPVGTKDVSDKFQIPQKLYGRQNEIESVMKTFDKVCNGTTRVTLVAGFSGIGKSALINEIHKPIVKTHGYFASGKFDQFQRDIPYKAVIQAFQDIAKQLLTESKERTESWKSKLLEALGPNGQVIIDVIPEVELIIGKQPPVPELPPTEAQNRFNLVFKSFLGTFTRREHPLVIFLDDLQWADSATLDLLKLILSDPDIEYLYLLGAYRDNEVSPTHPFILTLDEVRKVGAKIDTITLKPLDVGHINELLSETLRSDLRETETLAKLIQKKTDGNPFFVNEFLKTLYQEKLFNFVQGKWDWDLARIEAQGITDNVVELVAGKIQKLQPAEQDILKLASCVGNKFDLSTLALVQEKTQLETAELLRPSLQMGMLVPEGDGYKYIEKATESQGSNGAGGDPLFVTYRFLHDRVQQAASSLMEDEERTRLHLSIGRHLRDGVPDGQLEEHAIDIVNHLNNAVELISSQDEKMELAQMNLIAGSKAKSSNAYGPAMKYLTTAMGLLPDGSWKSHYELTRDVYTEKMETHYLEAEYDTMYDLGDDILKHVKTPLEKVKIYELRTTRFESENKMMEALWVAREILKELGVPLPKHPNQLHVAMGLIPTLVRMSINKDDFLENRPNMTDPEKLAAMKILAKVSGAAYLGSHEYLALIVFSMIKLSIKYGNVEYSGFGYVLYSVLMCGVLGFMKVGYRFGQLGLRIISKFDADSLYAKALGYYSTFTHHQTKPLAETYEPLLVDSYKGCVTGGDQETAAYVLQVGIYYKFCSGANLAEMDRDATKYIAQIRKLNQEQTLFLTLPWHRAILMFLGMEDQAQADGRDVPTIDELISKINETNNKLAGYYLYGCCEMYYYMFQDYEKAEYYSQLADDDLYSALSLYLQPWHFFHRSLIMIARSERAKSGKRKYLRLARKNLKLLKVRAKSNSANQDHKVALVEAEFARLEGKDSLATEKYDVAAKLAGENGFVQEEALANELAARFYEARGREKIASAYMREAHFGYERWGSRPKMDALVSEFPQLFPRAAGSGRESTVRGTTTGTATASTSVTTTGGARSGGMLDIGTVMKASRAISGEIKLDNLLDKLMKMVIENAGAQKGMLILDKGGRFVIEAEGEVSRDDAQILQSLPVEESENLSRSILNYVERTREDVVLNDAANEGSFTNDSYVQSSRPKSVLCSPIINQGKLIGMVYLENNLTSGAFTPDRLSVLTMLTSQAAISLENASLYANLEEKVEERTAELRESKKEIDDIMANVQQGLLTINRDGTISSEYSQRVAEIFERDDLGEKKFEDMYVHDGQTKEKVGDFLDQMLNNPFMSEKLFARANPLANYSYTMVNAARKEVTKVLDFNFSRIHGTDEDGNRTKDIEKIMVVIDDRTEEFELKRELEQKAQEQASKVEKLYQILQLPPNVFSGFISESSVTLDTVYQNLNKLQVGVSSPENLKLLQVCYREVHTLKGNARALNLDSIGKTAHELEDVFDELKENPTELTQELKDKVFEAVASLKNDIQDGNSLFEKILNMQSALQTKSQDAMGEFEERFRNIVDKEAQELGKMVTFEFRNELKKPLEGPIMIKLRNPLSHIIRNSMSHGIEPDEERAKLGKAPGGRITVALTEKDGHLLIACEDDGSGLKTDKIKAKAIEQKLVTPEKAAGMSESEIHKLIFASGLSTADKVSDIAGRGVGMDAVREDLKALNSVIMVASKPLQYTRFTIKIPMP